MKNLLPDLDICVLTLLAVVLAAFSLPALATAVEAGQFQFVAGEVRVISGAERTPAKEVTGDRLSRW